VQKGRGLVGTTRRKPSVRIDARLVLADPYGDCRLSVRRPGGEAAAVESFADDDPYLSEDAAFVQAVRTGERSLIRSGYADALRTHELAWSIRTASQARLS